MEICVSAMVPTCVDAEGIVITTTIPDVAAEMIRIVNRDLQERFRLHVAVMTILCNQDHLVVFKVRTHVDVRTKASKSGRKRHSLAFPPATKIR